MAIFRVTDFSGGISPFAEGGKTILDAEGAFFQNQPPYLSGHPTNATIDFPVASVGTIFWMTAAQTSFAYGFNYKNSRVEILQFIGTQASTVATGASFNLDRAEGGLAEYQNQLFFSDPGGEKLRHWDFDSTTSVTACSASGTYGPLYKHRERLFVGKHGIEAATGEGNVRAHIDIIQGGSELTEAIAFDRGERVNSLSNLNEYLVIALSSKRIVVWDGLSLSPDYEFNLADEPRAMYNLDNILYIWAPPHLYAMQSFGSQPQKVTTIPARFRSNNQIGRIGTVPGGLTGWNGILYFTTKRDEGEESTKHGLWAFGAIHAQAPNALSFIATPNTDDDISVDEGGHALVANGDVLFVGMNEGFRSAVYTYHPKNDFGDYEVSLAAQDLGVPEAQKQVLRVGLLTLPLPSGASVGVQYREEYSSTAFTPIKLNVVDEVYRYGVLNNAPYGRKFEFKLTGNASGASSPTITGFMAHIEGSVPSEFGQ